MVVRLGLPRGGGEGEGEGRVRRDIVIVGGWYLYVGFGRVRVAVICC